MNNYDSKSEEQFIKNSSVKFKDSFGKDILIWWVSITLVYTVLYSTYLDKSFSASVGGHIAGFFGLFTPVGLLSLIASILPNYLVSNLVALGLMGLTIFLGKSVRITAIKKIVLILVILLTVTYIADLFRTFGGFFGEGFTSWVIMMNGKLPSLN